MDWTRALVLLACLAGLVNKTWSTKCSAAVNPCHESESVTDTCDNATSTCKCKPNYSPIDSGCAPSGSLGKPKVDGGRYSGLVEETKSIALTCVPDPEIKVIPASVEYQWYLNGSMVDVNTNMYLYSVTANIINDITCMMVVDGFESAESDPFTVTGISAIGGYTFTDPPVIVGSYEEVVHGNAITLQCFNIPFHTGVGYDWNDTLPTYDEDLVLNPPITPAYYQCLLVDLTSGGFNVPAPPGVVRVPGSDSAANVLQKYAAVITSHNSPTDFKTGTNLAVKCELGTNGTVKYNPDTDIAFSWYMGSSPISGQTSDTLDTSIFLPGEHNITCQITPTGGSAIVSTPLILTAMDSPILSVSINQYPESPVEGHLLVLECVVYVTSEEALKKMRYSWSYDGVLIFGQHDSILQFYEVSNAEHGGGKNYACTAHSGEFEKTETRAVNISSVDSLTPRIVDNKEGVDYLDGKEYEFQCVFVDPGRKYNEIGLTYEWYWNDTNLFASTHAVNVTASPDPTSYKCKAIVNGTASPLSAQVLVESGWVEVFEVYGAERPLEGSIYRYGCTVKFYNSTSVPHTYYLTSENGDLATNTYYDTTASQTMATMLTCRLEVGGKDYYLEPKDSLSITAVYPAVLPVVVVDYGWEHGGFYGTALPGGNVSLSCESPSVGPVTGTFLELEFHWMFTDQTGSSTDFLYHGKVFQVQDASSADVGSYKCSVSIDFLGSDYSPPFLLTVENRNVTDTPCDDQNYYYQCKDAALTGHCVAGICQKVPVPGAEFWFAAVANIET